MAYNPIAPTSSRENRKPPTNVPQGMAIVETETPGVFEFVEAAEGDAVIEETATAGVYEVTDAPGAGAKARAVAVGTTGLIIGGA